jgi:molybdate transport system ATP-binding protein
MHLESSRTMVDTALLTAEIKHRVGAIDIRASFRLHQPWTMLFGPSGAGKSTILRILAGLTRPASGIVTLRDRTLVNTSTKILVPAGKRGIGFVMQQPALFPHMTVYKNVAFGLHSIDSAQREHRIIEMLKLFRIEAFAERLPNRLSGGERQRVALARALAPEPALLLLDEPFSGLDASLKESILTELATWLKERNLPALYVSHDVAEAYQTAADVIVIENGQTKMQGPVDAVLAQQRQQLLEQLGAANQPTPAPVQGEWRTSPQQQR